MKRYGKLVCIATAALLAFAFLGGAAFAKELVVYSSVDEENAKNLLDEFSKATGITVGSLYDYIRKKEDVLCLVFDVFHQIWTEHLEKNGVFEIEDPELQLRTAVCRMLELVYDYRT